MCHVHGMRTGPGICLRPLLGMQGRGSSRDGICLVALCRPVLLCEVLCLLRGRVLAPGDVIGCAVSDRLSGSMRVRICILSDLFG